MNKVFFVLLLLFLIYVSVGVYLYVKQRSFLYHPTPKIMTKYKNRIIKNDGEKINIIVLNEALIEVFPKSQVQVDTIENRGHADLSSDARYYKIMQDFIGEG